MEAKSNEVITPEIIQHRMRYSSQMHCYHVSWLTKKDTTERFMCLHMQDEKGLEHSCMLPISFIEELIRENKVAIEKIQSRKQFDEEVKGL